MAADTMVAYRDARICGLQAALLDHTGHVYRGLPNDEVRSLVGEINRLRNLNGWRPLDMTGRMRPRRYRRPPGHLD